MFELIFRVKFTTKLTLSLLLINIHTSLAVQRQIYIISPYDNPPYYVPKDHHLSKNNQTDRPLSIIEAFLNRIQDICTPHEFTITYTPEKLKLQDFITTLLMKNSSQLRKDYGLTDDDTIFIGPLAHTHNKKNVHADYKILDFYETPSSVLIIRNEDNLFLLKLIKGARSCAPILLFSLMSGIITAALLWLLEHRHNNEFPSTFGKGLWVAFWFTMVTMTTVGYGDKTPKFWLSRLLCLFWMILSISIIAMTTAVFIKESEKEFNTNNANISVLKQSQEDTTAWKQLYARPLPQISYSEIFKSLTSRDSDVDGAFIDKNVAAFYFFDKNVEYLKEYEEIDLNTLKPHAIREQPYLNKLYVLCGNGWEKCADEATEDNECTAHMSEDEREVFEDHTNLHVIPPLQIYPHFLRKPEDILDLSDGGLLRYLTICGGIIIIFAGLAEIYVILGKCAGRKTPSSLDEMMDKEWHRKSNSNADTELREKLSCEFNLLLDKVLADNNSKKRRNPLEWPPRENFKADFLKAFGTEEEKKKDKELLKKQKKLRRSMSFCAVQMLDK